MIKQSEAKRAARRKRQAPEGDDAKPSAPPSGAAPVGDDASRPDAGAENAERRPPGEDFLKIVEGVWLVGPSLVYIIKRWGLPGLILFTAGACFVAGLVGFGAYPSLLVSPKYRQAAADDPAARTTPGAELRSIDFKPVPEEGRADWIEQYYNALNRESAIKRRDGNPPELKYGVAVFDYEVERPTRRFTLHIQPHAEYQITARAVRQKRANIEPLDFSFKPGGVFFAVPDCDAGDRLILVVRAEWTGQLEFRGVRATFSPFVKSEGL